MDVNVTATRSAAGIGLAVVLLLGGWVSTRMTLDTGDAVDLALAKRVDPEQAQRKALEQTASYQNTKEFYQTSIDDTVARYELGAPSRERLLQPNTFFHVASPGDPRSLALGASISQGGMQINVKAEEVQVERRGMQTKNIHTFAVFKNVTRTPLAYFVRMRSRAGDCQIRAQTRYNAMVLMPNETAEISVCSGQHEVELTDLRVMEVSEIGARWLSKIPPQAVGHDNLSSRSHFPGAGVEMCAEIPAVEFARKLETGEAAWEDIVDFYSRHDCEHYRWWVGYERITSALTSLPAVPPASK
ncbi:hypothetical protein DB30_02089 [Enhygromyxa salina]|uniref:Uncharacterized protein n=1 Tax=Enhygromyxa salina TaxID=215803 RepID=A0A0C1Z357_9BACT|nr:hypothetical protein [Enhygromyxa salina]KIG12034.1 hypothetical protein DB30_02089 [Enhygromyxa salina]